jgi:hypothetical protein
MRSSTTPMKRLFLSSLALLLVTSSVGQVFAAAFCPRASGHECCFAQTVSHTHISSSKHKNITVHHMHMDGMSMDAMNMDGMTMNDTTIGEATVNISTPVSQPALLSESGVGNRFDLPFESCSHCVGHSGVTNPPVSFVSVSGQSGKDLGFVRLPVSRFLVCPPLALAHVGLPREHAPPGISAPRHILISVFLI